MKRGDHEKFSTERASLARDRFGLELLHLDEIADAGADDEMLVEQDQEVFEPAWEEPSEITCVAEEGPPAAAAPVLPAVIDPATAVPPTRVGQFSRCLALRLLAGTATQRTWIQLRRSVADLPEKNRLGTTKTTAADHIMPEEAILFE